MRGFRDCFSALRDPRAANARHDLVEVLFVALAAVLCGAEGCSDMAEFGLAKERLLRQVLRLEHGIPSHDTFSRVFRLLDPVGFEAVFRDFMAGFGKGLRGVVAIDGKAVRGAFDRGRRATPLQLVNVWAAQARVAVAQRLAPGRNEVSGALEVLALLSLENCIVTADALHCHPQMASRIIERGGAYALALKANHAPLLADAASRIAAATAHRAAEETLPVSHDRYERRRIVVVSAARLARKHNFPGLAAVARLETERRAMGEVAVQNVRHFVLSKRFAPARLLKIVRAHWTIENQLHWALDVVLDEDRARSRKDNAPENLAVLRKLALNLLRSHPAKASLRRKVKRSGWDDAFLLSMLGQMR